MKALQYLQSVFTSLFGRAPKPSLHPVPVRPDLAFARLMADSANPHAHVPVAQLKTITAGKMRAYVEARLAQGKAPRTVLNECCQLRRRRQNAGLPPLARFAFGDVAQRELRRAKHRMAVTRPVAPSEVDAP